MSGRIEYNVNGSRKIVEPGQFLALNSDTSYSCLIESEEPTTDICLQVTAKTCADIVRNLQRSDRELLSDPFYAEAAALPMETLHVHDQTTTAIFREMAAHGADPIRADELKTRLLQYFFTHHVKELAKQLSTTENKSSSVRREVVRRVHIAKDFLHAHYADGADLAQVAQAACMSPTHLIRKFNQVMGITPHQYLTQIRLTKSRDLLLTSDASVEGITAMIGFESASSFIRLFREANGLTPVAYRRQQTHMR